MRKFFLVPLLTTLAYGAIQRGEIAVMGTVEGVVKQGSTGTPVEAIRVLLQHRLGALQGVTDASGRFVFRDVPPGNVEVLTVQGPAGRATLTAGVALFTVSPGQQVSGLEILVYNGGIVSGSVALPSGQPAAEVRVSAVAKSYQIDGHCVFQSVADTRTDDRGLFRISGLRPGEYFIRVQNLSPDGAQGGDALSYTFHPGVLDPDRAEGVLVRDNQETEQVNFVVSRSIQTHLSGRVETDLPLTPSTEIHIALRKLDGCDSIASSSARLVSSGFNGTTSAFPGRYELIASVAPKSEASDSLVSLFQTRNRLVGRRSYSGRARIDVAGPAIESILVRVHTLSPLVGRIVTAEGSHPVPLETLGVLLVYPYETRAQYERGLISRTQVTGQGNFTVPTYSDGKHFLFVEGLPEDTYVSDIVREQRSIYESGIEIDSSAAVVDVVVDSRGSRITGTVEDQTGKHLSSYRIILMPKTRRDNPVLYKATTTDSRGTFVLRGIAPGDYKLFAFDNIPENAWLNATYVAPYEESGVSVSVSPSENIANIRVRSISSGR